MSDHADDALHRALDYDEYEVCNEDNLYHGHKSKARCKYCGKSNLHWTKTEKGWRLYTSNEKPHFCKEEEEEKEIDMPDETQIKFTQLVVQIPVIDLLKVTDVDGGEVFRLTSDGNIYLRGKTLQNRLLVEKIQELFPELTVKGTA